MLSPAGRVSTRRGQDPTAQHHLLTQGQTHSVPTLQGCPPSQPQKGTEQPLGWCTRGTESSAALLQLEMRGGSRCFSAQTQLDARLASPAWSNNSSSVNLQAHEMLSSHIHSSNSKASPPHSACPSYSQVGGEREHCDPHLCPLGDGEGGTQPKRPETRLKSKKVSRRKSTGTELKKTSQCFRSVASTAQQHWALSFSKKLYL